MARMKRKKRMTTEAKKRRKYWVSELAKLSGSFGDDSTKMIAELRDEIRKDGTEALLDHLRICGAVPEHYGHDSSEEKLYSKYTDAIISEALTAIGLKSTLIIARADSAGVQARGGDYSLVADAKAFRLSRTAKNQKDFKVEAMDGWRNGLDYAVLICPIYQLPSRTSQIYQQAIARNVCILSYAHMAALVAFAERRGQTAATKGLASVLKSVSFLHPSKSAADYWFGINKALVAVLKTDIDLWTTEKTASLAALVLAKDEALTYLRAERNRLLGLSHKEAIEELIRAAGLDSRIAQVQQIEHGNLLEG
jgi:type II restriction enzyme